MTYQDDPTERGDDEDGNSAGPSSGAGEDESSTENEGQDGHLHEDQKSQTLDI